MAENIFQQICHETDVDVSLLLPAFTGIFMPLTSISILKDYCKDIPYYGQGTIYWIEESVRNIIERIHSAVEHLQK